MSFELRPPTFRYVHSLRRRWMVGLAVATTSTLLFWACSAEHPSSWQRARPEWMFGALGILWLVQRIMRRPTPVGPQPRESGDVGPISRIVLPAPIPGTGWLFRRELLLLDDAIVIRSRLSTRRISRRELASVTPLPGELVFQLVEGETVRVATCRLPSGFGPLDVGFDHTLRAAGFAGLSYNERIARAIEGQSRARPAYRSAG